MKTELNIVVSPHEAAEEASIRSIVASKIGVKEKEIRSVRILKRSIDARSRKIKVSLKLQVYVNETPPDTPALKKELKDF